MEFILFMLFLWVAKSGAFWLVFRYRQVEATIFDCLLISLSPMLAILFPLAFNSHILGMMLALGLTSYVTIKCTNASFIPDALLIPIVVEIAFQGVLYVFGRSSLFPS